MVVMTIIQLVTTTPAVPQTYYRFGWLLFLALREHMISRFKDMGIINEGLSSLEALDLSNNSLSTVVTNITQLTNIRILVLNRTGVIWKQVKMHEWIAAKLREGKLLIMPNILGYLQLVSYPGPVLLEPEETDEEKEGEAPAKGKVPLATIKWSHINCFLSLINPLIDGYIKRMQQFWSVTSWKRKMMTFEESEVEEYALRPALLEPEETKGKVPPATIKWSHINWPGLLC